MPHVCLPARGFLRYASRPHVCASSCSDMGAPPPATSPQGAAPGRRSCRNRRRRAATLCQSLHVRPPLVKPCPRFPALLSRAEWWRRARRRSCWRVAAATPSCGRARRPWTTSSARMRQPRLTPPPTATTRSRRVPRGSSPQVVCGLFLGGRAGGGRWRLRRRRQGALRVPASLLPSPVCAPLQYVGGRGLWG